MKYKILNYEEIQTDKWTPLVKITTNNGTWKAYFEGEPEWILESPTGAKLYFKRNYEWDKLAEFLINREKGTFRTWEGTIIKIENNKVIVIGQFDRIYTEEDFKKYPHLRKDFGYLSDVEELLLIMIKLSTEFW